MTNPRSSERLIDEIRKLHEEIDELSNRISKKQERIQWLQREIQHIERIKRENKTPFFRQTQERTEVTTGWSR